MKVQRTGPLQPPSAFVRVAFPAISRLEWNLKSVSFREDAAGTAGVSPDKDMIRRGMSTANQTPPTVAAVAIFRSELLDIWPVKGLSGGGGMMDGGVGPGLVCGRHLLITEEAEGC